ncbi:hypothetical protein K0M31_016672, partial [Melipona bicolor]
MSSSSTSCRSHQSNLTHFDTNSALVRAVSRRLLATWLSGRGGLGATKSLRNATKLSVERAGTVIDSPRVGRASCGRPEKKKSDQEAASLPRRKQEKKEQQQQRQRALLGRTPTGLFQYYAPWQ